MDLKTLEYMEERAVKGRKIVDRIERLLNQVDLIKRSRGVIDLYTPANTVRLDTKRDDRANDDYVTRATAGIYNAFIDITLAEIRNLEQELAEL
jgi:hypothetical protein